MGVKAVVLVFPEVRDADAPALIDAVQFNCKVCVAVCAWIAAAFSGSSSRIVPCARILQSAFVERGLMLGEFHRFNNSPGLRNPEFFPLRTPYPSLAMRYMVPSDLPFLSPAKYPPRLRVAFLESFLSRFGRNGGPETGDSKRKKVVKEAKEIAGAREALKQAYVDLEAQQQQEEEEAQQKQQEKQQGSTRPSESPATSSRGRALSQSSRSGRGGRAMARGRPCFADILAAAQDVVGSDGGLCDAVLSDDAVSLASGAVAKCGLATVQAAVSLRSGMGSTAGDVPPPAVIAARTACPVNGVRWGSIVKAFAAETGGAPPAGDGGDVNGMAAAPSIAAVLGATLAASTAFGGARASATGPGGDAAPGGIHDRSLAWLARLAHLPPAFQATQGALFVRTPPLRMCRVMLVITQWQRCDQASSRTATAAALRAAVGRAVAGRSPAEHDAMLPRFVVYVGWLGCVSVPS